MSPNIVEYSPELRSCFSSLNREWIEQYFEIEPTDNKVFDDPEANILNKGGAILFALVDKQVVGTCALVMVDPTTAEVCKMAVTESHRGKGVGALLLDAIIKKAKAYNLRSLILYSNTSLTAAMTMYRKFGFREIPKTDFHTKRSNVKMQLML